MFEFKLYFKYFWFIEEYMLQLAFLLKMYDA